MQPAMPMRMRRPRRHRFLTLSVFFITYSVFHAVFSAAVDKASVADDLAAMGELAKATTPLQPGKVLKVDEEDKGLFVPITIE
ncbi:unnamed protein product [Plutella xylostella]|uniref:(diamondback moth) hypothetical protein n=1 Tax=Plutella xylostella TaxID=51655 RepID=A0A8S4EU59_PLUXY|nr:unnamed protein product [Plutella xylostella]